MSIRLGKITRENWYECSRLAVRAEQSKFVNSNLLCIAEVQFHPGWGAYAIYYEEQMVGFVMYEDDEDQDEWWISALMIAADHQGKGYGKTAVQVLFPILMQKGCTSIWVGYADDNLAARVLFIGLGFKEIGLDDEGDMVAKKDLLSDDQSD
jgi:diamine N-acetyltransferase